MTDVLRSSILLLSLTLSIACDSKNTCNSNSAEDRDCTQNCRTACSREEAANCKQDTSEGCFKKCETIPEQELVCQRALDEFFICASNYHFVCSKEGYYEPTNWDLCNGEIDKLRYLGCH